MIIRRRIYGVFAERGPRFLYIYGDSSNGKTTFLHFALKLLTGQFIEPQGGNQFSAQSLPLSLPTVFPLLFDDVSSSKRKSIENVFKSYWEKQWTPDFPFPHIVITSNTGNLPDWAKTRSVQLHFDVQFPRSGASTRMLRELIEQENHVFRWFAHLYLQRLQSYEPGGDKESEDDELELARIVMKDIYSYAEKPLPELFPKEPIDLLYDKDQFAWLDLLDGIKKAAIRTNNDRIFIDFNDDMTHAEIKEYQGMLPQTIKRRSQGKTLIIESPMVEFEAWLGRPVTHRRQWLNRFSRLIGR